MKFIKLDSSFLHKGDEAITVSLRRGAAGQWRSPGLEIPGF